MSTTMRTALAAAAGPITPTPQNPLVWEQTYTFTADSLVFSGHFPSQPVLPAVVQILMAQVLLEEKLEQKLTLAAVPQAKFSAPLGPDTPIVVQVQAGKKEQVWDCALLAAGGVASRFQVQVNNGS